MPACSGRISVALVFRWRLWMFHGSTNEKICIKTFLVASFSCFSQMWYCNTYWSGLPADAADLDFRLRRRPGVAEFGESCRSVVESSNLAKSGQNQNLAIIQVFGSPGVLFGSVLSHLKYQDHEWNIGFVRKAFICCVFMFQCTVTKIMSWQVGWLWPKGVCYCVFMFQLVGWLWPKVFMFQIWFCK